MSPKEYLSQLQELDNRITEDYAAYEALRKKALGISSFDYSKTPLSSRGSSPGASFEKAVSALMDASKKLNAEIDEFVNLKEKTITEIRHLENPTYVAILYKRYVEYKSLDAIAKETNYSYSYVRHLHGWALQEFGRQVDTQ